MSGTNYRNCPICNEKRVKNISDINLEVIEDFLLPTEYSIVACSNCGHVYNDVEFTNGYTEYYSNYQDVSNFTVPDENDHDYMSMESRYLKSAVFIDNYCEIDKSDKVLDVGCSYGGLLINLKKMSYDNLYGLDMDDKSLENLKNNGISVKRGSIFDVINDFEGSFDLIVLGHILEHLHNPKAAIENVSKWLKPNGKILIEVPDLLQYPATSPFPGFFAEHEHINHFSLISLMNLMDDYRLVASYSDRIYALIPNFPCLRAIFEKCNLKNEVIYSKNDEIAMEKSLTTPNEYGEIVVENIDSIKNDEIIIWGAGMYSYRIMTHTNVKNMNIVAIVDKSQSKHGKMVLGRSIKDTTLVKRFPNAVILVCSTTKCNEIIEDIRANGYENRVVIPFIKEDKND